MGIMLHWQKPNKMVWVQLYLETRILFLAELQISDLGMAEQWVGYRAMAESWVGYRALAEPTMDGLGLVTWSNASKFLFMDCFGGV